MPRCLVPHTQAGLYGCTVYCISGEAGPARRADRLDAGRLRHDGGAQDLGVTLVWSLQLRLTCRVHTECTWHSRHIRRRLPLFGYFSSQHHHQPDHCRSRRCARGAGRPGERGRPRDRRAEGAAPHTCVIANRSAGSWYARVGLAGGHLVLNTGPNGLELRTFDPC